jgi:hypothetical protein
MTTTKKHDDDFCINFSEAAEELVFEAKQNMVDTDKGLNEFIASLPDLMSAMLHTLMADFDYRGLRESRRAVVCRMLAATLAQFDMQVDKALGLGEAKRKGTDHE